MDSQTLMYIAGNQVVLLDLKTKSQSYLRSSSGGGIGFITVWLLFHVLGCHSLSRSEMFTWLPDGRFLQLHMICMYHVD